MDAIYPPSHSFILKIWLEHPDQVGNRAPWRGSLTHVPEGKRRYVRSLPELNAALEPYIREMGGDLGLRWRVRHWLVLHVRRA